MRVFSSRIFRASDHRILQATGAIPPAASELGRPARAGHPCGSRSLAAGSNAERSTHQQVTAGVCPYKRPIAFKDESDSRTPSPFAGIADR